eukprot:4775486-Pleurochrysis_carterae.AAC.1
MGRGTSRRGAWRAIIEREREAHDECPSQVRAFSKRRSADASTYTMQAHAFAAQAHGALSRAHARTHAQ